MRTINHRIACSCMFVWLTSISHAPTVAAPQIRIQVGDAKAPVVDVAEPVDNVTEIVAAILGSSASPLRRYEALETLLRRLESTKRVGVFYQVLEQPDRDFAVFGARMLLRESTLTPELVSRISEAARTWTGTEWRSLIEVLFEVEDSSKVRLIANTVLLNALNRIDRGTARTDTELHAAAGEAFQFVCMDATSCPRHLVERMLRTLPESHRVWLALACRGGVQKKDIPLAASIYQDEDLPLRTRHAAAAAVASWDPAAKQYLSHSLDIYFQEMGSYPLLEDTRRMYESDDAARRFKVFRERIPVIDVLLCLNEPMAREIVFSQIGEQNEAVHEKLVNVAARRWPVKTLELAESGDVPGVGDAVLAMIAENRPELEARCRSAGDAQRVEDFQAKLGKNGLIVIFGSTGYIVPEP